MGIETINQTMIAIRSKLATDNLTTFNKNKSTKRDANNAMLDALEEISMFLGMGMIADAKAVIIPKVPRLVAADWAKCHRDIMNL